MTIAAYSVHDYMCHSRRHGKEPKTIASTYCYRVSLPSSQSDIMKLPVTAWGNRYAIVFQDAFTKCPLIFPLKTRKQNALPFTSWRDNTYVILVYQRLSYQLIDDKPVIIFNARYL